MKKIIVLLLLFFTVKAWSQVPGYQGKRFMLSYSGQTFIRYDRDEFGNIEDGFIFSTRLMWRNELSVSYVVSRKSTLGISLNYARPRANCIYESVSFTTYDMQGNPGAPATASLNINEYEKPGILRYNQFGATMNWQIFPKKYIAPVGTYHQFSIGFTMAKLILKNEDEMRVTSNIGWQGNQNYQAILKEPYSFACTRFSYHIGRQNPIGKNIYLNTAIGINRFFLGDYYSNGYFNNSSTSFGSILTFEEYLNQMISRNFLRTQMIEVKLGIGFIK